MTDQKCPKCGRSWRPWPRSKLTCHAACVLPPALQDDIYQLKQRFPRVTVQRLARDFGVPVAVMNATLYAAAKRAGKKGSSAWR